MKLIRKMTREEMLEEYAEDIYKELPVLPKRMIIKSCSTCKHDGELVCATHGCHNKERYEAKT